MAELLMYLPLKSVLGDTLLGCYQFALKDRFNNKIVKKKKKKKLTKKITFPLKTERVDIAIEFCIFELV